MYLYIIPILSHLKIVSCAGSHLEPREHLFGR